MTKNYNTASLSKWSTERLEAKVAELQEQVAKDAKRTSRRAVYAEEGVNQRVRSLLTYSSALNDRKAGVLPYTGTSA